MSRGRSAAVYVVAALIAIGIGASAALLRPAPTSGTSMKVRMDPERVDPAVLREQLLETLIADARAAERVERLRSLDVAVMLVEGGEEHRWAQQRLLEDDVPRALALAVAHKLSRRGEGPDQAAALLERFLAEGSPDAVAVASKRDEVQVERDVVSRSSFAVYRGWVLAWGEGVGWSPRSEDGTLTLDLRRQEGGARALAVPRDGAALVQAREGEGPRIQVAGVE